MICVSIGRTRHKMFLAEIHEAVKRGAELIELRLDFLAKAPDFKRLLAERPVPMVATIRRQADGGRWTATEEQREMLLRQIIVGGIDWVDVETDLADRLRRFGKVKRIVSYHNLREMPEDLEDIHARMCQQDPDVVKLAVRAEHPLDNLRVLNLIKNSRTPTVAHCMGDLGIPSRILAGKFGAPFTYAAFNKERGIAPGILSFDEMVNVYHFDRINADTQVYAVIGDPVSHSLSPHIHNAAFQALGLNCVYIPIRVPRNDLTDCLQHFDALPIQGYSVTIPHKESAAAHAKEQDPNVQWTGAANTLVRLPGGGFRAYNTDCHAAVESLKIGLTTPEGPGRMTGRQIMILGAGGVARAIAHGMQQEGAALTIVNRTPERAQKLAEDVGCRFADWAARHSMVCEILINCTPVGMHPNVDESPIHHSFLRPGMVVFDTIYTPETTLLIKEAKARTCQVLTGVDMFVRQAALQFKLFTGREPPVDLMRKIVKRVLSPVAIRDDAELD